MEKILLIGKPNVGKSSLFNSLVRQRVAIVSDVSGTTRDTNKIEIDIFDKKALLIDSGGLDDKDELFKNVMANTLKEAQSADIILYMVDGKMYPSDEDKQIFYSLLKLNRPIALLVNKVDGPRDLERSWEFNEFGAPFVFNLSVSHQAGINDIKDWIYKLLPSDEILQDDNEDFDDFLENFDEAGEILEEPRENWENKNIKIGIIGRVNVGKSSLLNALVKEQRSVVSSIAGTTIDPVNEVYEKDGRIYEFVDTAGIRKRGKIEGIERFALNRTEKVLEEADIALLVLDSSEPFNELDERIAGLASKFELGVIIVLNKWDKNEEDFDKVVDELRYRFKFLSYAPIISVSALGGKRIHKIYPLILEVYKNYTQKIKTSTLNEIIADAVKAHPMPTDKGKLVRIYYSVQFGFAPPKIALIMNRPKSFHFSYKRYLINKIREQINLNGSPIILIPRKRGENERDEE